MSLLTALGDQMHALAVEIADLQGSGLIDPYSDEEFELADLQLQAQVFGDLLIDEKLICNLESWHSFATRRVAEIRAEEEVR